MGTGVEAAVGTAVAMLQERSVTVRVGGLAPSEGVAVRTCAEVLRAHRQEGCGLHVLELALEHLKGLQQKGKGSGARAGRGY